MQQAQSIILASTSRYRRELLSRLGIPFVVADPRVDEGRLRGENAGSMAIRLAQAKARAVAPNFSNALIIGSDQVAVLGQELIGKPGHHAAAVEQLKKMSGRSVDFLTAVCVMNSATQLRADRLVVTRVKFRSLSDSTIESYLLKERPYDCAGSAKAEALGIALISGIESEDPTALIGLPLIALVDLLDAQGYRVI